MALAVGAIMIGLMQVRSMLRCKIDAAIHVCSRASSWASLPPNLLPLNISHCERSAYHVRWLSLKHEQRIMRFALFG